jgi:mRNA interferase MazF
VRIERGTVALLILDPTVGHEQQGVRPCIVVSDPDVASDQRFPLLAIVPVTGTPAHGPLYPVLHLGSSGLTKPSYALIDQLRSVDKRRVRRIYGTISETELSALDQGLMLFLGLDLVSR